MSALRWLLNSDTAALVMSALAIIIALVAICLTPGDRR